MILDTDLFASLPIAKVQWDLVEAATDTQTRGGETIMVGFGQPLWRCVVTLKTLPPRQIARVEAIVADLTLPGRFVLAHDPRHCGPLADPGGVILGGAAPVIHTLNADNRRMRVSGLPAGYALHAGDYIGAQYGSDPVRYAMHRLVSDAVASGGGLTGLFAVTPGIRPGLAVGAPVTLVRPQIKCVLRKRMAAARALVEGAELTFTQTLR